MKNIFLIIGAPGSGKTATASQIINQNISHFSIGEMYREIANSDTELGSIVKNKIKNGEMVPIEIAKHVIESFLTKGKEKIIIDGFPRDMEQTIMFESVLGGELTLTKVIEIMVNEDIARKRTCQRNRGEDDRSELYDNRMAVFTKDISEIRKYYTQKNLYYQIDGNKDIDSVVNELKSLIIDK